MLVLLDANVWIRERLLRSAIGASLLYALNRSNGRIGLLAVTRQEVEIGTIDAVLKAAKSIESAFVTVQAIVGRRPDYALPDAERVRNAVEARFKEIRALIEDIPVTMADYEGAMGRVINGLPPNERKEQFRDSLLLHVAVERAQTQAVHLVTADGDFYEGGRMDRGITRELLNEISSCAPKLTIYQSVEGLLARLGDQALGVNTDHIIELVMQEITPDMQHRASEKNYVLGAVRRSTTEVYATERREILSVSFTITYAAADMPLTDGHIVADADVHVAGTASYNTESHTVENFELGTIETTDANGERLIGHSVIFARFSSAVLGVRQIPYSVRRRLNASQAHDPPTA